NPLASTAVVDAIIDLGGVSAAASLFALAERRVFQGRATISVPSAVVTAADSGGFIAENAPVPVRKRSLAALTLSPNRFLVINEFSNESTKYSDFDANNKAALTKAAALLLDSLLFSNTASSASRPAGILNGLSSGSPAAAGVDARTTDIRTLAAALHTANAGARPVFIMAPEQFAVMEDKAGSKFSDPFFRSNALTAGTIIVIDVSGFVFAYGAARSLRSAIKQRCTKRIQIHLRLMPAVSPRVQFAACGRRMRARSRCGSRFLGACSLASWRF